MSIRSGMCNSFKVEILRALHDLSTDTVKVALYTSSADLGPDTTAYTATGEATGTNWGAGGQTLAPYDDTYPKLDPTGQFAVWAFEDNAFSPVTVTFRAALLYNASKDNRAISVLDKGVDVVLTAGILTFFRNPTQPYLVMVR